jgi:uncharacterized protein YlzI (FlbEa/FlbD family)
MERIIFIILHSKLDNAEIMINPYAIESIRCNVVNLHEHYYEVSESYEEIKEAIKKVMSVCG